MLTRACEPPARGDPMTRSAFTFALGALVFCLGLGGLPEAAEAQQPAPRWRIGVLLVLLSPEGKEAQAFRRGLRDAGYVEGRDVVIEWRSANGDYARLRDYDAPTLRVHQRVRGSQVDREVAGEPAEDSLEGHRSSFGPARKAVNDGVAEYEKGDAVSGCAVHRDK